MPIPFLRIHFQKGKDWIWKEERGQRLRGWEKLSVQQKLTVQMPSGNRECPPLAHPTTRA